MLLSHGSSGGDTKQEVPQAEQARFFIERGYVVLASIHGLRRARARKRQVAGVINFVGGWVAQAGDNCPVDFNAVAFRRYGSRTRVPELWLYGDQDRFYATASIRSYRAAYRAGGGTVAFHLVANVPENGHSLPGCPALWSEQVDRYLALRGLPAGRR